MAAFSRADAKRAIRHKVVALAARRGCDAQGLTDAEPITETGLLDSVAMLDLINWFEMTFDMSVDEGDLTTENFGSIDAMADYLRRQKRALSA